MSRDNTYVIRAATVHDASGMDALNRKSLPENYPLTEWETVLSQGINVSHVATSNNGIVGYCLAIIRSYEHTGERNGIVVSFAVDAQHRGRGIGKRLLKETLEKMSTMNVAYVTLTVRIGNKVAQRLYENFGFIKFQIISKYYKDGEDAYLMHLGREGLHCLQANKSPTS